MTGFMPFVVVEETLDVVATVALRRKVAAPGCARAA